MNCERKSRRDFDDLDLSFKFIPLACFAGANVLLTTLFLGEKARHGGFIPVVPHKAVAEVSKIGNL